MADIEIEIDGQKFTAKPNQTVIQVADEVGIYIPRFCYHKHLPIPANCRMCLVEIEKSPKTMPACSMPVAPGMKVFTRSQKTLLAQRAVMEFLLINHPLDCPICDQGGECELQDLSMGYGSSASRYNESKRAVADENLGPLISTEMTRCILCTRCIRFGSDIAGMPELGMTYRGEWEEVTTFVEHAMKSEVSGNIIDLCPVGALTSKPYRFTARPWELDQFPSVSPHDCLGSNLNVHTRYGKVMRVVSRENKDINQTWISDRDRFAYTGLYHLDRIEKPMVKTDGSWQTVTWQHAFEMAAEKLRAIPPDQIGALASPNSTLEEFYLLQKIMRELGSSHIDHRLRESDMQDQQDMPIFPCLNIPFAELEACDVILLIGSNLQKEQPLAALRLRKAVANGCKILVINPVDYQFNFTVTAKNIIAPHHMVRAITDCYQSPENEIMKELKGKKKPFILLGALCSHHPEAASLRYFAKKLAASIGAKLGYMTSGANTAGGWIAGVIPHRGLGGSAIEEMGLNAYDMLKKPRQAYLLLNVEPEFDCANAQLAQQALKDAKSVIAISQYRTDVIEKTADVIFPMAAFTETSGTYINVMGEWQSVKGVAKTYGESRPGWKILRALANFLQLEGFQYETSEEIKHEIRAIFEKTHAVLQSLFTPKENHHKEKKKLTRVGEIPIYAIDGLVRRAKPLQDAQKIMEGEMAVVGLHPETAKQLQLQENDRVEVRQGSGSVTLPVKLDERIAHDAALIAGGIAATSGLGDLFGEVEIKKC